MVFTEAHNRGARLGDIAQLTNVNSTADQGINQAGRGRQINWGADLAHPPDSGKVGIWGAGKGGICTEHTRNDVTPRNVPTF